MEIILTDEVKTYIKDLSSAADKAQIAQYLDRQKELGHRLKQPVSRSLRDGMNEIRPGPNRLLFFYYVGQIVVVHAFRKKTRKTPIYEIETAVRKRSAWKRHD